MTAYATTIDPTLLIGRDAVALAMDFGCIDRDGDEVLGTFRAEMTAVNGMMRRHAGPTKAGTMAAELATVLAMLCRDEDDVARLAAETRAWIESLGDPRRRAREVVAARRFTAELLGNSYRAPEQASIDDAEAARRELDQLEEATSACMMVAFNAIAELRIHDSSTLTATLTVRRHAPIVVGVVHLDDDEGGAREDLPTPELVA